MKIEDPRVTQYALGELPAAAREEFEKELALSDELQRELRGDRLLFVRSSSHCRPRSKVSTKGHART